MRSIKSSTHNEIAQSYAALKSATSFGGKLLSMEIVGSDRGEALTQKEIKTSTRLALNTQSPRIVDLRAAKHINVPQLTTMDLYLRREIPHDTPTFPTKIGVSTLHNR